MIFLDTNVILRFLTEPTGAKGAAHQLAAEALFADLAADRQEATFSEVVFHETCYILASRAHYGLTWTQIADFLVPILDLESLRLSDDERTIYRRALEIAVGDPKLESADALVLARAEHDRLAIATFDKRMRKSQHGVFLEFINQSQI